MGFRFVAQGIFPGQGSNFISSALAGGFFTAKPPRKFKFNFTVSIQIKNIAVVGGWIEEEQCGGLRRPVKLIAIVRVRLRGSLNLGRTALKTDAGGSERY